MINKKFDRLMVLELTGTNKNCCRVWKCKCICGNIVEVTTSDLNSGHTRSCGCLQREKAATRFITHGYSKHYLFDTWRSLIKRCYNESSLQYKDYGGRGIEVCDRWKDSFENFLEDMGEKPQNNYQINRIDNDGDYCPENCEWSSVHINALNKRKRTNCSSKYRGVYYRSDRNKWIANIRIAGKTKNLGSFHLEMEAALCYNEFIIENNLPNTLNIIGD